MWAPDMYQCAYTMTRLLFIFVGNALVGDHRSPVHKYLQCECCDARGVVIGFLNGCYSLVQSPIVLDCNMAL